MGFVLTILYLVTYYLTPEIVFGPLAAFRIELIIALVIVILSLPRLRSSFVLKTPQSLALIGLVCAAFMSVLIGESWLGGAVQAFLEFIPCAFGYFFVCLHCTTKKRLKVLVMALLFVCLFVIANGYTDELRAGSGGGSFGSDASARDDRSAVWDLEHPYLLMLNSGSESGYRLRGLGSINDPNDFGQLTVSVIPLLFIFWRPKNLVRNIACVFFPAGILVFGVFLTHSRGALLALLAIAVVAARRRIGTVPALVVAVGLFAAAMALNFTGGRDISANSGEDRTALWGMSMQLLESHPLFGVGLGNLPSLIGLTAHNSLMVCAAETGLFGLFFFSLFLLPTMRDALATASPEKVTEGVAIVPEEGPIPQLTGKVETVDKAEIDNLGRSMVLSLTGFLVTAWFLSRAFVLTLYLLGGIAEVIFEMALQRGMIVPRLPLARAVPYAFGLSLLLLMLMYLMLRTANLMH